MHEVSVAVELLEIVEKNAAVHRLKRVEKIVVCKGQFTCIDDHSLQFAFEAVKKDTICAAANLIIKNISANDVIKGSELILESIEGE